MFLQLESDNNTKISTDFEEMRIKWLSTRSLLENSILAEKNLQDVLNEKRETIERLNEECKLTFHCF